MVASTANIAVQLLAARAGPNRRALEALPTLGFAEGGAGLLAHRYGDVPQHVVVLHGPGIEARGRVVPEHGRRSHTEGLEDEGEDLRDSCAMEPGLVVVQDVQVRHAYGVVDNGKIIWDVEEDKGLLGAHVPVLDALADLVGEELGDGGGSERP
jgi:hypothetical protein